MQLGSAYGRSVFKRILGATRGRPFAVLVLLVMLAVDTLHSLPLQVRSDYPTWLNQTVNLIRSPIESVELWLFDTYQILNPRPHVSQPVTIVAIDERSLAELGQWPWPRDVLGDLIDSINVFGPAVIGLDMYMPEPDQNSPHKLAERLNAERSNLIEALYGLPTTDFLLSMALARAPTVLGAAGFDYDAYTTSDSLFTAPIEVIGANPLPYIKNYPYVLSNLSELENAAAGQALISVEASTGSVRKLPLVAAVNGTLAPSFGFEMLRIATQSDAIRIKSNKDGIQQVGVADIDIDTQSDGEVWLHYAELSSGGHRYLSAIDVLKGNFDPLMLQNKLVLIGMTGSGLSDIQYTALNEQVPGVEIHAQLLESIFDDTLLYRPDWFPRLELVLIFVVGLTIIWLVPRSESRIGYYLKHRPSWMLGLATLFTLIFLSIGFYLFNTRGLLFSSSSVIIGILLIMGVLFASSMLENLTEAQAKMARLVDNGIALGRVHQRDELLGRTIDGIKDIAACEAQIILLKSDDNIFEPVMQNGLQQTWNASISLTSATGKSTLAGRIQMASNSLILNGRDCSDLQDPDFTALRHAFGKDIVSLVAVPMTLADGKIRGIVLLINAIDPRSAVTINFDHTLIPFVDALATQTAVAIENQGLLEAQKKMLDAMIKMIAGAIDAKSPYTGGHCERVPELAMMLCQAATDVSEGPLADFGFTTEDEWREFRIGAWLHDCGKITSPEYVVDKATKLETIYNRLHEVRTRFEVLLRDAQIELLQAIYKRGEDRKTAEAQFELRKKRLQDDFAFIAECNQGGEYLDPKKIERIEQIAEQTWLRNFDDRIGLSGDESIRYSGIDPVELPVREQLLRDRPQDVIPRPPSKALDPKYGFKLNVPEHLYNHGELHNLKISRGTLTPEERFKINEHMVHTIAILEELPLPPNLSRVPEYAGTHHETLLGTGYPRRLTADELSVPSRIMAVADIFEALTAADRPYKKAKTLSESIHILSFFKKDSHIDPVIFDLFLTSGIYKTYAERFLSPDQIDEVDIAQYLGEL